MSATKSKAAPKAKDGATSRQKSKSKKQTPAQRALKPPTIHIRTRASSEQLLLHRHRSHSHTSSHSHTPSPLQKGDGFSDVWSRKSTRSKLSLESMSLSGLFHPKSKKPTKSKKSSKKGRRYSISEPIPDKEAVSASAPALAAAGRAVRDDNPRQPTYQMPEPRFDDPEMARLLAMLQEHMQPMHQRPPSISMPIPPIVQPTRASALGHGISTPSSLHLRRTTNASNPPPMDHRATPVLDDGQLSAFGDIDDSENPPPAAAALRAPNRGSKVMPSIHSCIADAANLPPPIRPNADAHRSSWTQHSSVHSEYEDGRGSHVYTVLGKAIASAMLAHDSASSDTGSAARSHAGHNDDLAVRPIDISKQRTTGDIDDTLVSRHHRHTPTIITDNLSIASSANMMTPKTAETFTTAQLYMGQPGDAPFPDPPPTVPLPARHSTSAPTAPLPSLPGRTEGSRSRGSDVSAIAIRRHLQVDDDDDSDNDDDDDDEQSQPSTPPSKILGRDSYASEDQQLPDVLLAEWLGAPSLPGTTSIHTDLQSPDSDPHSTRAGEPGTTQANTPRQFSSSSPPPRQPVTFAEKRGIIEAMLARIADLEARFSCVEAILGGLEHELALVVRGHDQNAVMKHGKIVDPATGKKPELRTRESQTQSPKSKMQQEQVQVDTEDGGFWHPENLTRYVSQSQGDFDKASTQTLVSIMSLLRGLTSIRQAKQAMASIDTVLSKLDLSASDN